MKYYNKVALVVAAVVGSVLLSACATSPSPAYRTYYMTRHCHYFYIDSMGNRVMEGRAGNDRLMGLPLHRDAAGRWFYDDSFGNRIYQERYCR